MELLSRGINKEFWNIDPHLRREVRVGNPDSYFQLHIKGVNLLQQTISTLAIFLKSLIMIANIYGVSYYTPGTFTLFHLVLTKIL